MHAIEERGFAAFAQAPFFGGVHQAHDLLQHQHHVVVLVRPLVSPLTACVPFIAVSLFALPVAGAMQPPAFTYHCCSHKSLPLLPGSFSARSVIFRPSRKGAAVPRLEEHETFRLLAYTLALALGPALPLPARAVEIHTVFLARRGRRTDGLLCAALFAHSVLNQPLGIENQSHGSVAQNGGARDRPAPGGKTGPGS